ncbi:MAG TPA: hypothetical protein VFQ89_10495 [Candidatus Binatia bacterium]|nr:hypothetical protein [Candidatus Binatia bacterium]
MSIGRKFLKKQSEIYKNPLNPMRFLRGPRVEDLKVANKAALVQRGKDPSVLIVAFTGSAKMLMMPVYEFFDLTKSLGYSRILLRDRFNKRYHRGIDRQRPDYSSFLDFLRREIKKLGAKKTIFVGTSAGGYAAIRVGHDLGADYVHAFGAQTGLNPVHLRLPDREPPMDLSQILHEPNPNTTYYLHYCHSYESDRLHAERVAGCPNMVTLGYPGTTHLITLLLARKGLLEPMLAIDNQKRIVALARQYYGNEVIVTGP